MNNSDETSTTETSTVAEAAPDQTRPRKKTAARKQRGPRKGREPRKQRQRRTERGPKKIETAAEESRKKSRSRQGIFKECTVSISRSGKTAGNVQNTSTNQELPVAYNQR